LEANVIKGIDFDHDTVFHPSIARKPGAFADAQIASRPPDRAERRGAVLYDKSYAITAFQDRIVGADSKLECCLECLVNREGVAFEPQTTRLLSFWRISRQKDVACMV
jgi:hypothetical protein